MLYASWLQQRECNFLLSPSCQQSSGQSDSAAQTRLLSALFTAGRFINHLQVNGAGSDIPTDTTAGLTANALRRGDSENIQPEKT